MKFYIIDPTVPYSGLREFPSFVHALKFLNLSPSEVQHCSLNPWSGIAVHQHGFYMPPERQHVFSIQRHLFTGPSVVYGKDAKGEISSIVASAPFVRYYNDYKEAVQAIEDGEIDQPCVKIGEDVVWVWPQPMPGYEAKK